MANFCLPKHLTTPFLRALKEGKLDPGHLSSVESAERRAAFAKIVGEDNAKEVNALFESKLLLKNQQAGIIRWARAVGGLSKEAARDLFTKLERLDKVLSPSEEKAFLADLAAKKLGTEVSHEEATNIAKLSEEVQQAQAAFDASGKTGLGAAKVALEKYVSSLAQDTSKTRFVNPLKETGLGAKAVAMGENVYATGRFIAENARAIVASVDNSLWFRQGFRVLTDPRYSKTWAADFGKSWLDIARTIGGKMTSASAKDVLLGRDAIQVGEAIIDGIKAKVYESPNYLNGRYEGAVGTGPKGTRLDLGTGEESYPTSFPAKIPLLGRFFKGAEVAYEAGAMRLRMDIADQVYRWGERTGLDMESNKVVGDLNEVINSMTGRGTFGKQVGSLEKGANVAFFSIKFFKSNVDYLTIHQGRLATPASRLAATNLLYTAAVTAAVLKLAQTLWPDDNKHIFDTTSSNFGKMKFGAMTFDLTHGAGGIVVAASRLFNQETTSGTTGKTTKLGSKYGAPTGDSILWDFFGNKLSPIGQVLRETVVNNKTFEGTTPTIAGEAGSLVTPITIANVSQFQSEPALMQFLGLIADGLGINTNVYVPPKKKP